MMTARDMTDGDLTLMIMRADPVSRAEANLIAQLTPFMTAEKLKNISAGYAVTIEMDDEPVACAGYVSGELWLLATQKCRNAPLEFFRTLKREIFNAADRIGLDRFNVSVIRNGDEESLNARLVTMLGGHGVGQDSIIIPGGVIRFDVYEIEVKR